MIDFLYGVPGKLKTLLSRIPSTVASDAKIQIVDNNVDTIKARVTANVATAANLATVDTVVDRIEVDTTTLLSRIAGVIPLSQIKSIQTGHIEAIKTGNGSGEDSSYRNIAISSVNAAKTICFFQGAFTSWPYPTYDSSGAISTIVTARMESSTNLRLSSSVGSALYKFIGRWYVVEFE